MDEILYLASADGRYSIQSKGGIEEILNNPKSIPSNVKPTKTRFQPVEILDGHGC